MGDRSDQGYLQPYREAVQRFGAGFEATLWTNRDAQVLRFDVTIDLAGFEDCVILDAGCGQGDFAARLLEREVSFSKYIGVDALPQMIDAAKRRAMPRCEFVVGDVLDDPSVLRTGGPDYVCFSGTLNTMEQDPARGLVRSAFEAAAQAVVFNFLSSRAHARWADQDPSPARRFDPLRWLDFCLTLSSRVSFTQSYFDGHDATIMVQHDG